MTEQGKFTDEQVFLLGQAAIEGKRNEREQREALRQAARIFELLKLGSSGFQQVTLADLIEWLELPVVQSAVALEYADQEGQP